MVSSKTYNDGEWHQVQTSRLEKEGSLKVDGEFIEQASAPGKNNRLQVSLLYFLIILQQANNG